MKSNPHVGSDFDEFLAEDAMLEVATAVAMKRVIAWQIDREMKSQKLTQNSCKPSKTGTRGSATGRPRLRP